MKMNDNFLLSKLFQGAMKPTDIRPFYFKAAREIAASEITIVTIIDESRFERLMTLAKVYQGMFGLVFIFSFGDMNIDTQVLYSTRSYLCDDSCDG